MDKVMFVCNVGSSDSLIVDTKFTSGPKESDLEFRVVHGVLRQSFSVWLTMEDAKRLHNVLANALHDWHENGPVSENE
jgi:hypothetical protein